MRKSIVTVLAAMSTLGMIATPAVAADFTEEVSVEVNYADLDLTAPAGTAVLDQRIEAATAKVCEKPSVRELKAMTEWEACKATAKAGALEQLSILEPYESVALASVF